MEDIIQIKECLPMLSFVGRTSTIMKDGQVECPTDVYEHPVFSEGEFIEDANGNEYVFRYKVWHKI